MAEEKSVMNTIKNNDKLEISIYPRGVPGYIYTPFVDTEGNLSWQNNGGLENPPTVNIMGPQGPQGLIEFQIVDELPATGSSLIMYLLRKRTGSQNLYDEYIWVNNAYELISEGKKTANEDAQYVVGYYYSTSVIFNLNLENFIKTGEYALIINSTTQGRPTQIAEETKVILKSYQANINSDSTVCQELMDTTSGKRFIRTCTKTGGSWSMGTWALESAGGVEVSDNTPTEDSTLLWVDTDADAEIFDPNNYYTKAETNAKIVNTLSGDESNKAPTVHAVNLALENVGGKLYIADMEDDTIYDEVLEAYNAGKYVIAQSTMGEDSVYLILQQFVENTFIFNTTMQWYDDSVMYYTTYLDSDGWSEPSAQTLPTTVALGNLKFLSLTQAQYNALSSKDPDTIYIIVG